MMTCSSSHVCPDPRRRGAATWPVVLGLLVLIGLLYTGWRGGLNKAVAEEPTVDEVYLADGRIQSLLQDCGVGLEFTVDPAELMEVMVGKLAMGHLDVLHRYKQLIALRGEEATPALTRLFEKNFSDEWGDPVLQNILATCAMMPSSAGLDLARNGFQHPKEVVRLAALDVIAVHGTKEDYDSVVGWIPMVAKTPVGLDYVQALAHCDFDRFAQDAVGWLENAEHPNIWFHMVPLLGDVEDPELADRMLVLAQMPVTQQELRGYLLVPAARMGSREAEGALTKRLTSDIDQRVTLGLAAIQKANLHNLAAVVLQLDERPGLRERAASVIASGPHTEESLALLNHGLADSEHIVRQACLGGLLERKDEATVARLLLDLAKGNVERESALVVLQTRWDALPDLPDRALEVLVKEYGATESQESHISILKVLGRIPRQDSARFLLDHWQDLPPVVAGLLPFRWAVGHAFNTGPAGMELLHERLQTETDAVRRMDLIGMIWQDKSEASEEVLMGILVNTELHPFERLFTADRLALFADPEKLMPVIKRELYQPSRHYHVRPAAQCLLWRWFGLPNA